MKKLTALALALCIILSAFALVACGDKTPADNGDKTPSANNGDKTPSSNNGDKNDKTEGSVYEIVAAAIEKTLKAKSFEAKLTASQKMDLMGNKTESKAEGTVKATAVDTDKPQASFEGKATVEGYEMKQSFYYDGQWKYFGDEESGRYKSQVSYEEFAKEIGAPEDVIVALPEAIFSAAQSKNNADGSLTVTLTVDETNMETLYKDTIIAVVQDVVGQDLNQAVTKDATIEITVADGYIRDYKVSFANEITAGSDKVTYETVDAVTFVSVDKDVTITVPGNLNDYYEMDWG